MISFAELKRIVPRCPVLRLQVLHPPLVAALEEFEITTPQRMSAFLAQCAHESAEFRHFEEIWIPTHWQRAYEGSIRLGNTKPGDGERFKGRGPIQITGRARYTVAGAALGVDLPADPKRASDPDVAWRIAGWFWRDFREFRRGQLWKGNLNELADAGDFDGITRGINGSGMNGHAHRLELWARAKAVLGG